MSDTPPPVRPAGPPEPAEAARPLTPEAVERVLADFRAWLTDLSAVPPPPPSDEPPAVDLHTLVAQFTALRHEVNLQTKATRSSLEQTGEALGQLREAVDELKDRPAAEDDDDTGPLLKVLVDVYDNLALALRQVEKQRDGIDRPLEEWVVGTEDPRTAGMFKAGPDGRSGFWLRLACVLGIRPLHHHPQVQAVYKETQARHQRAAEAAKLVRSSLDGLLAGYRMSLARADRALDQFGLEPIAAEGEAFDPELMEVVEVVGDTGRPAGEVVEEVRRGYLRGEVVFRYAQVKVAR